MSHHRLGSRIVLLQLDKSAADMAHDTVYAASLLLDRCRNLLHEVLGGPSFGRIEPGKHRLHFLFELPALDLGEQFMQGMLPHALANVLFEIRMYWIRPDEGEQHGVASLLQDVVGRAVGVRINEHDNRLIGQSAKLSEPDTEMKALEQ